MKLGRGGPAKSKPPTLPERAQTVTLVPADGKGLPARVLERGAETLLVAIMVPIEPLSKRQLEGLVLEFVGAQGRVRLSGTASLDNPSEPDVVRIEQPRSIEVLQEREFVRVKTSRPAVVSSRRDPNPVESFTIDLSGGGFLLAGPASLKIGDEVRFQLNLTPGELVIAGTGRVVRVDNMGHRAIAFESISELDRRRLIRFLFECQRAERQRGLATEDRHGS
jgi:PilZ domain-containing protein